MKLKNYPAIRPGIVGKLGGNRTGGNLTEERPYRQEVATLTRYQSEQAIA